MLLSAKTGRVRETTPLRRLSHKFEEMKNRVIIHRLHRKRDHEIDQELLFLGWTVIRFWGKDIKKNLEECVQVVEETVFEVKMSWDEYEE